MSPMEASAPSSLAPERGVLTLRGYGIQLRVERGHLLVTDGVGSNRRTRQISRVCPDLERIVVIGHSGTVTLDALKWMQDTETAFVQVGHDGQLISTGLPERRPHGEVLRAQALAHVSGASFALSKEFVGTKIDGQLAVLDRIPESEEARAQLVSLREGVESAQGGEELLTIEATAASSYWTQWESLEVHFASSDRDRIPDRWQRVGSRGSPYSKNAQHAVSPANAILNYLYAVLRAETRIAAASVGLQPSIGLYHATKRWRDSLSYDLMEPLRPVVDAYVLDLLEQREFERSEFFENRKGVVRVMPPLSEELSATAPQWKEAVGPVTEHVVRELMAWADAGNRGTLTRSEGNTSDGSVIPTPLTQEYRKEGRPDEQEKRKRSALESWQANQKWEKDSDSGDVPNVDYESGILEGLQDAKIREISEATGLSCHQRSNLGQKQRLKRGHFRGETSLRT